ncbi:mitochondrial import inner membrane translocase subunit TIM22 [Clavulina sp. PMI_390]|nr:mitochondrial import inner membrane translocase subunit TIM22 [Clavulina sp. PMI_390]
MDRRPLVAPVFPAGAEPLPPGWSEEDRVALTQQKKMEGYMSTAMESCVVKSAMSGAMGFGMGAFFSLMSTTFAYEDPLSRTWEKATMSTTQKTSQIFKDMGKSMWRGGRGFGTVGALYAGSECVIEGYRAKNDIYNAVTAGLFSGAVLARKSGPRAMAGGAVAFAAFSAAIDLFLRRETSDED